MHRVGDGWLARHRPRAVATPVRGFDGGWVETDGKAEHPCAGTTTFYAGIELECPARVERVGFVDAQIARGGLRIFRAAGTLWRGATARGNEGYLCKRHRRSQRNHEGHPLPRWQFRTPSRLGHRVRALLRVPHR